jgi:hypothetical protein
MIVALQHLPEQVRAASGRMQFVVRHLIARHITPPEPAGTCRSPHTGVAPAKSSPSSGYVKIVGNRRSFAGPSRRIL